MSSTTVELVYVCELSVVYVVCVCYVCVCIIYVVNVCA